MKLTIKIVIILFIFLSSSCGNSPTHTEVFVFIDISSTLNKDFGLLDQGMRNITKNMNLGVEDGLSGGTVKFFLLGETSTLPFATVSINSSDGGMLDKRSNSYYRDDEVNEFEGKLKKVTKYIVDSLEWDQENSKIYQQLCRELNNLNNSGAARKIVVVYSDMLENSSLFSFYNSKGINNLSKVKNWIEDGSQLKKLMEEDIMKECQMPSLQDININIVSKRSKKSDERINLSEKLWTQIFRYHNVQNLEFGAELSIN